MLIKACLNGSRSLTCFPALPVTPSQLAEAAAQAVAAGAGALHIHPRDGDGAQSLDAQAQGNALLAMRARCPGILIGVSTAIWIEPNPARRISHVQSWTKLPDFASVNFDEPGADELAWALLARGIGVEAGISTEEDVATLSASGLDGKLLRILIELDEDVPEATRTAEGIIRALDHARLMAPRLLHGYNASAWPMLRLALTLGYDTRIGLEDTLSMPNGVFAPDNAALVAEAVALAQSAGRWP